MAEAAEHPEGDVPVTPPEPQNENGAVVEEKEPGGSTPEDIYDRKEYRTRKKVEAELNAERIERARLEERLRALEENGKKAEKPPEKIYTPEEVQEFVDAGQLKPSLAAAYLARMEVQRALAEDRAKMAEQAPMQNARARIDKWLSVLPGLATAGSDEYVKADKKFRYLRGELGRPDDIVTRLEAIDMAHGDIERHEARAALRNGQSAPRMPVDGGGNGGGGSGKAPDFSHAPDHLKEYWKKAGLNEKEQQRHFQNWSKQQASKPK